MPRNLSLFPRAVDDSAGPAFMDLGRFDSTGPLGSAYTPFVPSGEGNLKRICSWPSIPPGSTTDEPVVQP
ncbi:MAG: hypothetical protein CM1200mP29_13790 [Verrucomicrobiota bacterium]|nr:MAG: hypothetical protein CM1200mP29_13790 [Verrucomicrobiota bacterium]